MKVVPWRPPTPCSARGSDRLQGTIRAPSLLSLVGVWIGVLSILLERASSSLQIRRRLILIIDPRTPRTGIDRLNIDSSSCDRVSM
jgi:3-polyprenyl-4-hydroxybenzoate decarboxylase